MQHFNSSSATSGKRNLAQRLCIWAGIVGPILFVLLFTIAGLLYPGYSPISQVISVLGASGAVLAAFQHAGHTLAFSNSKRVSGRF